MKTITFLMLLLFSQIGHSCDNCNVYLNVTPNDDKHSFGIYYRYRLMMGLYDNIGQQIMTRHANHGNDPAFWGNTVSEHFRTYELRGTYRIGQRFRTYTILPFVQNSQFIDENKRYELFGFGDPILIETVEITDPVKIYKNENFRQRLEMGFGIKAPLGRIDKTYHEKIPNLDLQPGTGSWDMIAMAKYVMKIKFFGIMSNITYKINTRNRDNYRYGNILNGTLKFFFQTEFKNFAFMPMIGCNIEHASYDFSTVTHLDTGGEAWFADLGAQVFWKKYQLFGEFQRAVSNKMNGHSQLINKFKANIGLIYNI